MIIMERRMGWSRCSTNHTDEKYIQNFVGKAEEKILSRRIRHQ
jgi:hypothetical protein